MPDTTPGPEGTPTRGVHVIPGGVPEGVVPPSASMATPRPDVPDELTAVGAQALRDQAHECTGEDCPLTEQECWLSHPVNWSGMVAGNTHIEGSADTVARVVLAAVLPEARKAWFAELFGTPEEIARREAEAAQRTPDDTVRLCELARPGEHEQRARGKAAADLKRAAAGRRDYASRAPKDMATALEAEADVYDTAARIAETPNDVMWALLPVTMWTEADRRGETK